jgi:hypothetical protein
MELLKDATPVWAEVKVENKATNIKVTSIRYFIDPPRHRM